ncbi:uncharacterized protein LOC128203644 [Mya arenaria]|uniref:uncharacterized protein LOC128203644 n=1 Tax=Mya arenaria TaxID=6604 RepID=UPI0022E55467|nr:uncharacterized protein LOC128203644 [Mya arenaria]
MATSDVEAAHRTAFQFCVQSEMTPINTLHQMKSTERYKNVSRAPVYKWHGRFIAGNTECTPCERLKYKDCRTVKSVQDFINCDSRCTVREVAEMAGINSTPQSHACVTEEAPRYGSSD